MRCRNTQEAGGRLGRPAGHELKQLRPHEHVHATLVVPVSWNHQTAHLGVADDPQRAAREAIGGTQEAPEVAGRERERRRPPPLDPVVQQRMLEPQGAHLPAPRLGRPVLWRNCKPLRMQHRWHQCGAECPCHDSLADRHVQLRPAWLCRGANGWGAWPLLLLS